MKDKNAIKRLQISKLDLLISKSNIKVIHEWKATKWKF